MRRLSNSLPVKSREPGDIMNRSRVAGAYCFPRTRFRRILPAPVAICVVVITCSAQAPSETVNGRAFEVVSVKPNRSGSESSHAKSTPGRYDATNIKVKELIQDAFGVKEFQISGAPRWTETEGFD